MRAEGALLERERELETLEIALDGAALGRGSIVIVEGPAGIGKTRLLAEAAGIADRAGFSTRDARGGELERDMPFGVARQLLEQTIARASTEERKRLLSGSARHALAAFGTWDDEAEPAADRFAAINGLYWLVANLSTMNALALMVDDAQWSDASSLRFLLFLARRIADLPVVLFVGVRSGESSEPPELSALRLEAGIVKPDALSPAAVSALIADRLGNRPSEDFAAACASASAGNPFLVIEILRELASVGRVLDAAAAATIPDLAAESVARKVLLRLQRIGGEAVAMARAVAVLGRTPHLRHAAELAGIDQERARVVCDELRAAEIFGHGIPIDFIHPLVRQAIYREQPDGARAAAHRRAADVLACANAPSEDIAAHLLKCPPDEDQEVVAALIRAASAAVRRGTVDTAVTYLERALAEPPKDDLPVRALLGSTLIETEQTYRAPDILADVIARTTDPPSRLVRLRLLLKAHIATGNLAAASATCDEAIAAVGETHPEVRLDLEATRYFMVFASRGIDPDASGRIDAVAAGLRGKTSGERVARQALALDRFVHCAPIDEVVDLVFPFPDLPWVIEGFESAVPISVPKVLAYSGRWDDARNVWEAWVEVARRQGRLLSVSIGTSLLAETERLAGRLHDSEVLARTAWEIAQLPDGLSPFRWSAWMNLGATLLARGDVDGFTRLVGDFDLSLGPLQVPLPPWPLELRAYLNLELDDFASAAEDFLMIGDAMESVGWLNPSIPPHWRQEATEALAALGRGSEAESLVAVAEDRAKDFGSEHTVASVMRARAATQSRDRAVDTLRTSVEILDRSGPPHQLARSLRALGGVLRRRGDRREARAVLERALEVAHRSGAEGVVRRIREELSVLGSRPRRVVRTGVEALTATEFKVAQLAAGGLTNKEVADRLFVSVRTVETHLTHAYERLGIAGRRELAGALERHAGGARQTEKSRGSPTM